MEVDIGKFHGRTGRLPHGRGGQGFGLWAMVNKFTLAFAAASMLPLLDWSGFQAGNTAQPALAMTMLMWLYAVVPSLLKLVAIALLAAITLEEPT